MPCSRGSYTQYASSKAVPRKLDTRGWVSILYHHLFATARHLLFSPLLLLTPTGAESEDAFYAPTFLITGSSLNATFTTSRVSRIGKGLYFGYDDMERKRIWR